jgi:OOP family OmpA-OmpF porin
MSKKWLSLLSIVFIALLMSGCAGKMPAPVDFQPVGTDGYTQKVDNFVVVMDASSSMTSRLEGTPKFLLAKSLVERFNGTIPGITASGALRTFGHDKGISPNATDLFFGMGAYSRDGFAAGLDKVNRPGGFSPMGSAITGAAADLKGLSGKSAVIIFSDGQDPIDVPLVAAQNLKKMYGDNVCIYTVAVGSGPEGIELMQEIADIGGCGLSVTADDLASSAQMASCVKTIFFEEAKMIAPPKKNDADGDGVLDEKDMCPNTPAGVAVDEKGCPQDMDKDGVQDYRDTCPNSPLGAMVDEKGCWKLPSVLFDFDKYSIKDEAMPWLTHVAEVMKLNQDLTLIVNGHTCIIGTEAYNQVLSEKRAKAVIDTIAGKGISRSRFTYKGFNFAYPAATNKTKEGRALNRRADMVPVK